MMRALVYSRRLVPRYLYRSQVMAWQCSVCRKIFSLSVGEVEQHYGLTAPDYIEHDFEMHQCEVVLIARQEQEERRRE